MTKSNRYRNAVFIVVYRKEKNKILYLLLKRKLHWVGWEFPKGGVKGRESMEKTINREIKEETGQKPISIKKYPVSGRYKYERGLADRKSFIGQTYRLYSAELKREKVRLDKKEHSAHKWGNFNQALKLITYPSQRKCLRIVNKKLN